MVIVMWKLVLWCYCKSTREVYVHTNDWLATTGPQSALRRDGWSVTVSDGSEVRLGQPAIVPGVPNDIVLPVDVPFSVDRSAIVSVSAVDVRAVGGMAYSSFPVTCPVVVEPQHGQREFAGRAPRDDLASDPATGALVIRGGTYLHHDGRSALRKVLVRLLTDRAPRGLGWEKGAPLSRDLMARYQARAREIVGAQEGVVASRVAVEFDRHAGLVRVDVDVRTPSGWERESIGIGG